MRTWPPLRLQQNNPDVTASPETLQAIRLIVREELVRVMSPEHPGARVESMTVAEFAYVVRLHEETVKAKIRRRTIPAEHVSKKAKAFRIRPVALAPFGVTPQEAAARLAEFRAQRLQRSEQQSKE